MNENAGDKQPERKGLLKGSNEAERAAQAPEYEDLRTVYLSMRYEGAAPVWRPQPSRVGVLVPVLAFALLCSLAVWWLWPYGAMQPSGVQDSSKVLIAEVEPTPDFPVPDPISLQPTPGGGSVVSVASVASLSTDVDRGGQDTPSGIASPRTTPLGAARTEARESLRSGPAGHSTSGAVSTGGSDGTAELAESTGVRHIGLDARAEPKDVNEGLQRLRSGARSLRQAGVALPVAQSTLSFRLPKVPDFRPSRPSSAANRWSADEGAARD